MEIAAKIMIAFVAIEHLYILYIEMFAWETIGKRTFRNFPSELFTPTKALAANQGLYNGFLSAGLIWSLFISDSIWSFNVACFFLVVCVNCCNLRCFYCIKADSCSSRRSCSSGDDSSFSIYFYLI